VSVGGGGYFRLYPWTLSYMLQKHVLRQHPLMFYIHPWEVDPEQPRLAGVPYMCRCRHYVNLGTTYSKLEKLLQSFRFGTMSEAISAYRRPAPLASGELLLDMVPGMSESVA